MIEAGFSSIFGIKSLISVEESTLDVQSQTLDELEGILQMGFEMVGVIVIASDQSS